MDLVKLRLLRDVSARGSIAATARHLGYTPSAVSQQLSTLEKQCGVALLERTHRGVTLTPAGRLLEQRAHRVVDELEQAEAEMATLLGDARGLVSIGAFATVAAAVCAPAAEALAVSHPFLVLRFVEHEPLDAPQAVLLGDLDVAIVVSWDHAPTPIPPELVSRRLLSEELLVAHLPALPAPRSLGDLAGQRWVISSDATICGRATRAACRGAGFEPDVAHLTDDFGVAMAYAAAGLGVTLIPPLAFTNQAPPPGVCLSAVEPPMVRHVDAVVRASNAAHPLVAAALDALSGASAAVVQAGITASRA
jgi:DNA-binding transcriptional LysR family regulator